MHFKLLVIRSNQQVHKKHASDSIMTAK